MEKAIQIQFGQQVIELLANLARSDLKLPDALAREEFAHVTDARIRRALAQVFYGVRWIYKLGLALLFKDEERAAHIRTQIVDYASICEALLSFCVGHAISHGLARGESYKWKYPDKREGPLRWGPGSPDPLLRKQGLYWLVRVAEEFGIIGADLAEHLQWLRTERNAIHIRERVAMGSQAYLAESKKAYELVYEVIRETKLWMAAQEKAPRGRTACS